MSKSKLDIISLVLGKELAGGGCIVLISFTRNITGTNSVAGGAAAVAANHGDVDKMGSKKGGAGGAGVYASYLVENLFS